MRFFLFDDAKSTLHYLFGLISAIMLHKAWWVSFGLFHLFLIYELIEFENPISTIGDVVEFICGFISGIMLLVGICNKLPV